MSKLSLAEAAKQINSWRGRRKTKRGAIPKYLWDIAVELSKQHSPQLVAKKMKLNGTDLRKKIKNEEPEITFEEITTIPPVFSQEKRTPTLELTTSTGLTIKVYS